MSSEELKRLIGDVAENEHLIKRWQVDAGASTSSLVAYSQDSYDDPDDALEAAVELEAAIRRTESGRVLKSRVWAGSYLGEVPGRCRGVVEVEFDAVP